MVRRGFAPSALRMRMASSATATPEVLSLALGLACHVSRCAPSITTSSARSLPGISPTMFDTFSTVSPIRLRTSTSTFTAILRRRMRYMRL